MHIPENLLRGKKILLGVTGSIAAYKSLELLRLYIKAGAEVRVVMTNAAKKFVAPLSFEALSRNRVLDDTNESWADDFNHIKISQWADLLVIAPVTANTIAKLSNGIADTILTQCALAYPGIKLLAPSANTNMIQNPMIQASQKMLAIANYEIIATQTKELACQVVGDGAMAEPLEIFWYSARTLLKNDFWSDRRVIVTGGGTIEKLDDVRIISNRSSGKMASALATALFVRGADVNLIATRFEPNLPTSIHTIDVESSKEMGEYLTDSIRIAKKGKLSKPSLIHDAPIALIQKVPYLFMAAAVSDYIPTYPQQGKLKKEMLGEVWNIAMKQNVDLLQSCHKEGIKTIAFKAETDPYVATQNARNLLINKGADAVCLNIIDETNPFGSDTNQIDFITHDGEIALPKSDKLTLSLSLLDEAAKV
ncbi:bifunctional phosphopantothenoylcysteine decarboxylase/phosphopantothenate--cysteine ligase CoaBC [Sulfuricurvum sp.]|uniref:bifunctional phosphopantothenoylcysteine decarboxylase/phosphopantothenate--cysteine ligase CoaBC n=1 Tax=Sulfuricurvum sp. TaxID=2025608 RepID=UPI0019B3EFA6|nr:bifunctional phosphopantothenoylcysteine decarboxylase/phosphopantothenate--cysteine ligase CoaBC [Sulfuricurvum sp.]MBD3798998.1 bifunctional phosphopantothenoylcysteine decarboxylase/phosphopantothenate--cysteine ligase CoaBC [Campylobacterota bacterium]MBD3806397.1 bifunctional phosphopantothenoylcysteine decarboxylase/phosphopantothenate--cysteine ligase CoaBC [Sulfuricurvum sp.]